MKFFSTIVQSALLITTPALTATELPLITVKHKKVVPPQPIQLPDLNTLSYDEVLALLKKIESDSFGKNLSLQDLEKVERFVSFLANEGATPQEKPAIAADITDLESDFEFATFLDTNLDVNIGPAVYIEGSYDLILCKKKVKKSKGIKHFLKKHKKAILIGAIIVVTVAVVVVAAVTISATAASAAALTGATSAASANAATPGQSQNVASDALVTSVQEQTSVFKETVAQEQFAAVADSNAISMEENGRIIGSVFAHKVIDSLTIPENPTLGSNLGFDASFPKPAWSADLAFNTNYGSSSLGGDLNVLSYQARGDWALGCGYYTQASQDFSSAIAIDPGSSISYLGRGVANFELGQYESCVADYNSFVSQNPSPMTFSWSEFSLGFAKELPKGICDSGEGLLLFLSDLVRHPVQTSKQVYQSLEMLSVLVKSGQWSAIGEVISPEVHQLITQWDTLTDREKGELSGYAFGKHGADILIPGTLTKVAAEGMVAAKELGAICKNLQAAERVLVLEAVAEGGAAGIKVGDVVCYAERTLEAGEDLGLTVKEMGALKESGQLEQTIGKGRNYYAGDPTKQAWYDFIKGAEDKLEPHIKKFMPESQARGLIESTGMPTLPRPPGIPENYRVQITENGAGMIYVHPTIEQTCVRVMPGKPYSEWPHQQKPYVTHMKNGRHLDKNGKPCHANENRYTKYSPEVHIPYEEYIYME